MRFLVLGGTVFLSRAVAVEALARGHEVVCAARGESGSVPEGARHVAFDRTGEVPSALAAERFDAVVDVARTPSWVRRAVAAWPGAHWTFVSTVNVYPDDTATGGTPATLPLREPVHEDVDLREHPEAYGPMKVACEQLVREGVERAFVMRPGLIVGPGDPTGRFSYWPARLADVAPGEPVLAGGKPTDPVQVVDVRDLAAWVVRAAEEGLTGDFDGVGPVVPVGELLAGSAAGLGVEPSWTWLPDSELEARGVAPWMGPRSLPLWLPRPTYDAMMTHDPTPSFDAGLTVRPIEDTARDTLAWLRATPGAAVTGLTREEEAEVLGR